MSNGIIKMNFIILAAMLFSLFAVCTVSVAENQWEPAIKAFEQQDAKRPAPKGAVLFIGDSCIRWWRTAELFPEFATINRAFGGAQIPDINYYIKRIVVPYKPRVVVFYCGGNDLFAGKKSPLQVFTDFQAFYRTVQASLPKTRIIYMSLTPGPSEWDSREYLYRVNRMVEKFAEKETNLVYADVATGMLNSKGVPDPKDYQSDGVHLTYQADKKWAALLRPILRKTFIEARKAAQSKDPNEPNRPQ